MLNVFDCARDQAAHSPRQTASADDAGYDVLRRAASLLSTFVHYRSALPDGLLPAANAYVLPLFAPVPYMAPGDDELCLLDERRSALPAEQ